MAELPLMQCAALKKGGETYVLLYLSHQRDDACRALGRWASDPALSFTWYDAAVLTQKIRAGVQATKQSGFSWRR